MSYFFVTFISVLLLFHFFIFYFFSKVFSLGIKGKIILGVCLLFFAFSYFIGRIFVDRWANIFTYILNYLASVWLGLFFVLVLFIAISCIVLLFLKIFEIHIDLRHVGISVLVIAFVYSLYGLWNATNIIVKEQKISITNIPEEWKSKKVLFVSDMHLGHVLKKGFLEKVIEVVNKQNPDLLFISGDIFDGFGTDISYFSDTIKKLNVKDGVYLVEGNHDVYMGADNFLKILEGTNIKLLQNEIVDIDGVQLVGITSASRINSPEVLKVVLNGLLEKGYYTDKPSILLFHEPYYTRDIANFGIDLQLSGHTHDGQLWPLGYIAKRVNYENGYGLNRIQDFNIYVTNGVGTWGPPMRTGNTPEVVVLKFE